MNSTLRKRLIFLAVSVLVLLALFFLSVRRGAEDRLPPTPSYQQDTAASQMTTPTPAPLNTNIPPGDPTPSPTAVEETPAPAFDSEATAQAGMARATRRARAMSDIVRVLYADGSVSGIEGIYNQLEDESISFNRPGYYSLTFSEFQALNFVIRANILWSNAGEEISYPTAGCGFVFGYHETNNQNRILLTLDGNIRAQNITDGLTVQSTPEYYGELDRPAGHANLILAVDQGKISMYVNNVLVSQVEQENITDGWVGYLVQAGSSYDYGTTCEFKDIELWHVE